MAQLLGQVNPGTIVKLNENGQPVEFYVAKQDYESGLNGQGRVLLVRKTAYDSKQWNTTNTNTWASSSIRSWLNTTYKSLLDSEIQNYLSSTKYYYTPGNNDWNVSTRSDAVFLLSVTELNFSVAGANVEGSFLPNIAVLNDPFLTIWTRSPYTNDVRFVWNVSTTETNRNNASLSKSICPVFTLPFAMLVESDGTITLPPTLSIYTPSLAMQGQSLPIQWSPISNATSYQLQRNTGSTWETVYTGTDTSYTDTVGSWTTVQYQVAVDIGGGYGAYTQSASIPVIAASTLAISGQDGSLGTITADIPYTVTSDTGNPISIVRTVNGVRYASATVESGFAYNIPVMELPTGDGTIVITASVQSSSGLVTVTRTWTYTKTPINFSNSGSVASLSVNGENILPTTLAEAVRTSPVWGGSLDLALQKLSSATFYETITPTAELGTLTPGDIIYLNENGSPVEFYVASMDYEPDYNDNRVLVVRKEAVQTGQWNSTNVNTYDGSVIDTWFNETYLQTLDNDVQTAISTTTIQYTPGNGNNNVTTIQKAVFGVSLTELGISRSNANTEGSAISVLSSFASQDIWTRSPATLGTAYAWVANIISSEYCNSTHSYLPAFTLPTTFTATLGPETSGLYDIQNNLLLSLPGVNIETGSYTGTGTYGSSNPNSLTFGFVPKVVIFTGYIISNAWASFFSSGQPFVDTSALSTSYTVNRPPSADSGQYSYSKKSKDGTTLSWYNTSSATLQLNQNGNEYYYIAIG